MRTWLVNPCGRLAPRCVDMDAADVTRLQSVNKAGEHARQRSALRMHARLRRAYLTGMPLTRPWLTAEPAPLPSGGIASCGITRAATCAGMPCDRRPRRAARERRDIDRADLGGERREPRAERRRAGARVRARGALRARCRRTRTACARPGRAARGTSARSRGARRGRRRTSRRRSPAGRCAAICSQTYAHFAHAPHHGLLTLHECVSGASSASRASSSKITSSWIGCEHAEVANVRRAAAAHVVVEQAARPPSPCPTDG